VWASACFWTRWGARCAGRTSGLLDTHICQCWPGMAVPATAWGYIICTVGSESDVFAAWLCAAASVAVAVAVAVVGGCHRNVGAAKQGVQTRVGGADWLQHRCLCRPPRAAVESRPGVPPLARPTVRCYILRVWLCCLFLRASPRHIVARPQTHSSIKPSQFALYPQRAILSDRTKQFLDKYIRHKGISGCK